MGTLFDLVFSELLSSIGQAILAFIAALFGLGS